MGRRCQICSNTSINIINRALLGGATLRQSWKKIINPPLLAIVVTVALNFVITKRIASQGGRK